MGKQTINVGTFPNDRTGDKLRVAGQKINDNFEALYNRPMVSVKEYGAKGDNLTDDYAAILAAINYLKYIGGGYLSFPQGSYIVGTTIVIDAQNIHIMGVGMSVSPIASMIKASHSSGAVIHIKSDRSSVYNIGITSTNARRDGAAGSNYGLLIEPVDASGAAIADSEFNFVEVRNQPSHGIVLSGSLRRMTFEHIYSFGNKGHGMILSNGTLTGRTFVSNIGIINMRNLYINNNSGNGLVVGDFGIFTNGVFRVHILNADIGSNATDAAVRVSNHQVVLQGQNIIYELGSSGSPLNNPDFTRGVAINGQLIKVINHRAVDVTATIDILNTALPNRDIEINSINVFNNITLAPQEYAIIGAATVRNLRVNIQTDEADPKITNVIDALPISGIIYFNGQRTIVEDTIMGNGEWDDKPLRIGVNYLWVDGIGKLRIKTTAPANDTDGEIVGTQTA